MAPNRDKLTRRNRTARNFAGCIGLLLLAGEAFLRTSTLHHGGTSDVGFPRRDPQVTARSRGVPEDRFESIIRELSHLHGVEPALVKAVIRAESGFNPSAVSPTGARGLMQLMPRTAKRHGVRKPHDPRQNIEGGVKYLRSLLDLFDNNLKLALAAYNAGASAVKRHRGLPPFRETRTYVARVLQYRAQYMRSQNLSQASGRA